MKEQITKLLDELADKSLTFGCVVECGGTEHVIGGGYHLDGRTLHTERFCDSCPPAQYFPITRVIGHDLLLGNVLAKIANRTDGDQDTVVSLWEPLGLSRSLQEIFFNKGVEWQKRNDTLHHPVCSKVGCILDNIFGCHLVQTEFPTNPAVRLLGEFLLKLNLTQSK